MMAEYIVDIDSKITVNIGAQSLEMTRGVIQGCRVEEEIIRCRDCRFRSGENNMGVKPDYCTKFAHYSAKLEGFCAWAERTGDKS